MDIKSIRLHPHTTPAGESQLAAEMAVAQDALSCQLTKHNDNEFTSVPASKAATDGH